MGLSAGFGAMGVGPVSRTLTLNALSQMEFGRTFSRGPRAEMTSEWLASEAAAVTLGELRDDAHATRGLAALLAGCDEGQRNFMRYMVGKALRKVHQDELPALQAAFSQASAKFMADCEVMIDANMTKRLGPNWKQLAFAPAAKKPVARKKKKAAPKKKTVAKKKKVTKKRTDDDFDY